MAGAELHAHTTASDGQLTPSELVRHACEVGLEAIAITDHDTVAGIAPAIDEARRLAAAEPGAVSLEVIPGIEISCDTPKGECHILGYFIDHRSPFLEEPLAFLRKRRRERGERIVERLAGLGIQIRIEDRKEGESIGRPHIAAALVKAGVVATHQEAFRRFLAAGQPAYEPSPRLLPPEAFDMVLRAGGVPVLAHPHTFDDPAMIGVYAKQGLLGIEARYATYGRDEIRKWEKVALDHGLVATGGSDFHGHFRPDRPLGVARVELDVVERLKKARRISG